MSTVMQAQQPIQTSLKSSPGQHGCCVGLVLDYTFLDGGMYFHVWQ